MLALATALAVAGALAAACGLSVVAVLMVAAVLTVAPAFAQGLMATAVGVRGGGSAGTGSSCGGVGGAVEAAVVSRW